MDVKQFENNRWNREDQKMAFRHRATLEFIKDGSVLDLGSGDGLLLSLLKAKGIAGKGLDISEEGVAKARAKGIDAAVHDFGQKLPFADASFDTVVMLDVLEHLYDPNALLAEAARVSKRAVIVGVPNFNSLPARLQALFGKVPENNLPKKGHVYWFNYRGLISMFKNAGLTVRDMRANAPLGSRLLIGPLMNFFARVMPGLFSLSFVVVGRKSL